MRPACLYGQSMNMPRDFTGTLPPRPIIQSLWIGGSLSVMERLCIQSFLQNGHPFRLYVYGEVKGVPSGVELRDASEIIQPGKIFKYKDHDSYAGFSNIFRYKLLLEKGGWWVDMDVICLKPFPAEAQYVFASERLFRKEITSTIGYKAASCAIMTPSGSCIMEYCHSKATGKKPSELKWGEIGPNLLNTAVESFGLHHSIVSPSAFCPINFWQWKRLIARSLWINCIEQTSMIANNSYAVHLWNESWRRQQADKDLMYPPNSIYERLKRRYSVMSYSDQL